MRQSDRKHRILLLGGEPSSLVRFRGALLTDLVQANHEVHAAAGGWDVEVANELNSRGVKTHAFLLQRAARNPLADIATLISIRRLINRIQPDTMIAYTAKPVAFGLLASRCSSVKSCNALITGLGNLYFKGRPIGLTGRILDCLYHSALNNADSVIFQNPDDEAVFRHRGHLATVRKIGIVAGSGIELDRYPPRPLPEAPFTALMISRLVREKGVQAYLEAARLVRAEQPDIRFVLAGGFDQNPRSLRPADLQPAIDRGDVRYVGHVTDVLPLLEAAHVFVLPSMYGEGVPRTILEALSVGRPVITTDMPGCRETVRNENGILVSPNDPHALANAILRLARSPDQLPGMSARSRWLAENVFDVRRVNRDMLKLLGLSAEQAK
jgi:glycosyltransferase involved in cell wall biosynthesis